MLFAPLPQALKSGLKALKKLGVEGVVVSMWWGAVENEQPGVYDWSQYTLLLRMVRDTGLQAKVGHPCFLAEPVAGVPMGADFLHIVLQVTLCMHQKGECPLPEWVREEGKQNPDIFYADRAGTRSLECLSLGADHGEWEVWW